MSDTVIRVEHLSKLYKIGKLQQRHDTLRDYLVDAVKNLAPDRNQGRISKDHLWALKDVNFEVNQGEVVGIIGKNGAGKSTLLKILSRITSPTEGRVRLRGRVGSLLEVGTGFHPELTGRENIYLNGAILGMHRVEIERKFDEIVAFSEIEKFLDTPIKRYSSGMYVRLAFAVAAHLEPEILLVDEVLAVGDAAFQKKCLGKMGDVAKEGRTVIFVSHQLSMINTLCEAALLLEDGHLLKIGSTAEVIQEYLKINTLSNGNLGNQRFFSEDKSLPAQLLAVEVFSESNRDSVYFDAFEEVYVKITYVIRKLIYGVAVIIKVKRNGELLFISFDTDGSPDLLDGRLPGVYSTILSLPAPLKAGQYSLDLSIGKLNVGGVNAQNDAIQLFIEENSFDTSLRSYSSKRPGVVAVHMIWDTNLIEQ